MLVRGFVEGPNLHGRGQERSSDFFSANTSPIGLLCGHSSCLSVDEDRGRLIRMGVGMLVLRARSILRQWYQK